MLIKFLVDYGEAKAGEVRNTKTDEDAQTLIDEKVAVKYVATDVVKADETDEAKATKKEKAIEDLAKKVEAEVKEQLKDATTKAIPAVATDKKTPWGSLGEFAKSVIGGRADQKMQSYCDDVKATGLGEAINADGGFLIPEEFSTTLLTAMNQQGVLAPKARNFPVNHNINLPYVNITSQATSWTGGVTIYKPGEAVAKTASQPAFAKCELQLHKMTGLVYATDELIQDSPIALETFLSTMVSTEFALTKDEDIVNGSGAGEALGVMNAPCMISVAKETGQPADTIVTENVLNMMSRLHTPSRSRAVWIIAPDAMPQIGSLSLAVGTGGAPVFIANIANAMQSSLLGLPIIWSPHCQTVGDSGDIILADFSQYVTITKAGREMETATSIHVKFVEDETAFRFVVRFDGQPWWSSAVTPKHGSSTVSPFVKLAARA